MSCVVKRDGTTLWRGNAIGSTWKQPSGGWYFEPLPSFKHVGPMHYRVRHRIVTEITRALVRIERQAVNPNPSTASGDEGSG